MTIRERPQAHYADPSAILDPDIVTGDLVVCDISGSMDEKSFERDKSKRRVMHEALVSYLEMKRACRLQDHVAVIAYQATATVCCPLLNVGRHGEEILSAMDQMARLPGGGTAMKTGLSKAVALLREDLGYGLLRKGLVRCLAYSDGFDSSDRAALRCAEELRRCGVLIESFGVGRDPQDVDEEFLRGIASRDGSFVHYRFLGDGHAVRETFTALANGVLTFDGAVTPWTNAKR